MKWNEGLIARAIARQTLASKCVVLVDRCTWTGHECDVLAVTRDLRIIDVEIKISRADLKADAKKDKWWIRNFVGYSEPKEIRDGNGVLRYTTRESLWNNVARQHPPKVWKHYYAMPRDIWKSELLECLPSPHSGVILMREQHGNDTVAVAEVVRRATPAKDAYRLKPEQVMDIARLANLRMWEAYQLASSATTKLREAEAA